MKSDRFKAGRRRPAPRFAVLGLLGLGLASASQLGCSRENAKAEMGGGPVPVRVATAVAADVPLRISEIGRVEPYLTVTIKPQIAGQVAQVHFTEGQDVKTGDPLFTIDARPFQAALQQAEANLARDQAMARDAADEAKRQKQLSERSVGTQREYDQAQAKADAAAATVRADEALVETARLKLAYCSIRAPIDGRTGSRSVDQGNIVKENETPMVTINQISPIYVVFAVPEQHLAQIKSRMADERLAVQAAIQTEAGAQTEHGVLTFLDNQVHTDTGTIKLKGTFENAARRLWPGQFVQAALTLTTLKDAVVVPTPAIQKGQSGLFVYVVKSDRTVESRPVETGLEAGGRTVLTSGVSAGETVVTDGQLRLVSGAAVSIKPPSQGSQPS